MPASSFRSRPIGLPARVRIAAAAALLLSDGVLTWTPSAALAAGAYDVTVYNVRSEIAGDSVAMQAPNLFTFSVP